MASNLLSRRSLASLDRLRSSEDLAVTPLFHASDPELRDHLPRVPRRELDRHLEQRVNMASSDPRPKTMSRLDEPQTVAGSTLRPRM